MLTNLLSFINTYFWFFIIVHLIISLILSLILSRYIKKRFITSSYKVNKHDILRLKEIADQNKFYKTLFMFSLHRYNVRSSFLYFFIFNLSMPLLGYISSIFLARLLVNTEYKDTHITTNILNLDEFGISFLNVHRVFGEGSLNDLMQSKYAPQSKKLRALNVLSANTSPANLRIIKQTLSSTDDEIRMFGYAIIDKAEKKLAKKINQELENLKQAEEDGEREASAEAAKELAFMYWELLYTELSHESLNEEFLEQVENHINIARSHYLSLLRLSTLESKQQHYYTAQLSKLHLLLGRVHMKRQEYEQAITEFTVAQELREDDANFILPYMAESYYLLEKYHLAKSVLSQFNTINTNATIYPILEQWKRA